MRRAAFGVGLLLTLLIAVPVAASSARAASSWRATLAGATIRGGSTTILNSTGTGTFSARASGVTARSRAVAEIVPAACGVSARAIATLRLPAAGSSGIASGARSLTAAEVASFEAIVAAHGTLSVYVVDGPTRSCGNEVGAPSVAIVTLTGTVDPVGATYTFDYPQIGGVPAGVATALNDVLASDATATVTGFGTDAREAGKPMDSAGASSLSDQVGIALALPTLISLDELVLEYRTGAAHPLAALSTYAFDLTSGHEITLADLFRGGSDYLGLLSAQSRTRLRTLLNDPSLDSTIDGGTMPKAANFASWELTAAGLRITFGEYQVGPYVIGMPAITIPYSVLRPVINPSGVLARLTQPAACVAGDLSGRLADYNAGLGNRFATAVLTNRSALPCYLRGTPESQLLDGHGHVLIDSASGGASGLPHVSAADPRFILAPGARTTIGIRTSNFCRSTPAAPVRVGLILPGGAGRVIATPPGASSGRDLVPPCLGPIGGSISTNGWGGSG